MQDNDNKEKIDEEDNSVATIIKSLVSIIGFGFLGYLSHDLFGWNLWWSIGIGLFIGWFLPGFLEGLKEGWIDLKNEINGKEQEH